MYGGRRVYRVVPNFSGPLTLSNPVINEPAGRCIQMGAVYMKRVCTHNSCQLINVYMGIVNRRLNIQSKE
jgi:hypothetical protein